MFFKKRLDIKFDKQLWLMNREKRYLMVKDIVKQGVLANLNKEEVVNLLGFEFNDENSKTWSYYLGTKQVCFIEKKKFIYIYFNEKDLVAKLVLK